LRFLLNLLFPLIIATSRLLRRDSEEKLLRVLIGWNNRLVKNMIKKNKEDLLVLIPICLQSSLCETKILDDVQICKRCGGCKIKELVQIKEAHGIDLRVVTGGRLAKEIVEKRRPKAIVACACEKELAIGIFEIYPLPVFGVINERPKGPCKDTQVDVNLIYQSLGIEDVSS